MAKKKDEITIRSSAAEYLTYVASVGDQQDSIEMTDVRSLLWNVVNNQQYFYMIYLQIQEDNNNDRKKCN